MGAFKHGTLISTTGEDIAIDKITTESIEFLNPETGKDKFLLCISIDGTNPDTAIHVSTNEGTVIVCSSDTQFYTLNRGWVLSSELVAGDELVCPTGDSLQYVTSVEIDNINTDILNSINIGSAEESDSLWEASYAELGHFVYDVLAK